jgi:hypothetical protein
MNGPSGEAPLPVGMVPQRMLRIFALIQIFSRKVS